MKVFIGWGYEVAWIEDQALPLVKSYGVEVLTGKELQGQVLKSGVKDKIEKADACIFFTTRRGKVNPGLLTYPRKPLGFGFPCRRDAA
jgi:hypothetical protein